MNRYEEAIRRALEDFCREYTGRQSGWHVETWLHPITRSVRSAIVIPEFASVPLMARIALVLDYLKAHLTRDEYLHSLPAAVLTPYEYEHTDWRPVEMEPLAVAG